MAHLKDHEAIFIPYDLRNSLIIRPLQEALLGGEGAKQAAETVEKLAPSASDEEIRRAIQHGTDVKREKLAEVQAWLTRLFPKSKSDIDEAFSVGVLGSVIGSN
jgi:hypothetical protein